QTKNEFRKKVILSMNGHDITWISEKPLVHNNELSHVYIVMPQEKPGFYQFILVIMDTEKFKDGPVVGIYLNGKISRVVRTYHFDAPAYLPLGNYTKQEIIALIGEEEFNKINVRTTTGLPPSWQ
ncbi:MAG TPA: hypothetical protein VF810_00740, partial [Patescibacteria group bacterium]